MAVSILTCLPAELPLEIAEYLPISDRMSLSSTNSQFRRLLAPGLFNSIRFLTSNTNLQSLERVLHQHARYVHELHLVLVSNDLPAGRTDLSTVPNPNRLLSILLDQQILPNLDALRITLKPHPEVYEDDAFYHHPVDEDRVHEAKRKSNNVPWRDLLSNTFKVIALCSAPLKRLELLYYTPVTLASFEVTPEWTAVLNGLEEFKMALWSILADHNSWSNTCYEYEESVSELQRYFFQHLTAAKRITFAGHWGATIGHFSEYPDEPDGCIPFPFTAKDMPRVEHFELEQCFIDHKLLAWLETNPSQLRSFRMTNCFSPVPDEDVQVTWAEFFARVRNSQSALLDFSLMQKIKLKGGGVDEGKIVPAGRIFPGLSDESVYRELEANPDRKGFEYCDLWWDHGIPTTSKKTTAEHFWKGDDQREYELLMEMVQKNQAEEKRGMEHRRGVIHEDDAEKSSREDEEGWSRGEALIEPASSTSLQDTKCVMT